MKLLNIIGVLLVLSVFVTGCTCYPGYYAPRKKNPDYYYQQQVLPTDCQDVCNDAVTCYNPQSQFYPNYPLNNCSNCLSNLLNSVFVLGEGAFCLAASPFVLVGNLLCNACGNYETQFPCCSNEVYYGDNCEAQYPTNPCDNSNYYYPQSNNCSNCNTPYENNTSQITTPLSSNNKTTQLITQPTPYRSQVTQTVFRQNTPQRIAPPQRMAPPRPQVLQNTSEIAQ
ncbi:MAG: hypothetical protein LBC20_12185 [Planctomycetaceae bacterium]|nr:hypothetical protein [Planctomycetaceae bacterium]